MVHDPYDISLRSPSTTDWYDYNHYYDVALLYDLTTTYSVPLHPLSILSRLVELRAFCPDARDVKRQDLPWMVALARLTLATTEPLAHA